MCVLSRKFDQCEKNLMEKVDARSTMLGKDKFFSLFLRRGEWTRCV